LHRSFGAKIAPQDDKRVILGGALALDIGATTEKQNRALAGAV